MAIRLKTMMVEDSAADAELLAMALQSAGFDPEWTRVDNERDFCAGLEPSLQIVFSDFSMPNFSANRVLQLLKEENFTAPCIIVSGTIGEEQVAEMLKSGATDYVLKDRLDRVSFVVQRALRESRDRVERKHAEEQVRIRTMALEAAANGILITDRDGKILWANRAFSVMTGYTLEQALNQNVRLLQSGEHPETFYRDLWETILSGQIWRGSITNRHKDGSLYWEDMTITPVRAEGEISHFIAVKQDVTERKQAEAALESAQEKLNRLLAHSPAVIYSLRLENGKWLPVWVSENIKQLFGYNSEDVRSPEWWAEHVHPEDRRLTLGEDTRLLTSGHSNKEYRFKHNDGGYRWLSDEQQLVRDAAGQPCEIVGVWMDVTDRKGLEAQLRQAQKLESIGQLAGGVAHDFNNILTVIQGHASLLLSNRALGDGPQESAQQIALASERAATLTRQLLTFSRKQVMQPKVLDVNDVVGNVLKMLKRLLREDVSLQVEYSANLPMVHADAGMLEQVLMNLAVNGRDAMPNGGELTISTAEVAIGPEYLLSHAHGSAGKHVRLSVSDSGCGIDPEILPRIFEPFFTTKPVGYGTGLGLATVHGIVHQHRGWIDVESERGKGTVFRVYFPVVNEPEKRAAAPASESPVPHGTETILLVEDEDAVRTLARNVLERKGYKVIEAVSAVEALKNWDQLREKVNLVLTDMVMPGGMTGLDLMKKLNAESPSLPAIYTSGYSVDIVGKEFELRDGINFLQKPYGPRRLAQTVRDALDKAAKGMPEDSRRAESRMR
ncbi:MAG TPA: PAS domain S-box protein [Verrucomicrobiae bacterium]|nr:PAS domain S-box protein [Verrucomicrobiae bacterium]